MSVIDQPMILHIVLFTIVFHFELFVRSLNRIIHYFVFITFPTPVFVDAVVNAVFTDTFAACVVKPAHTARSHRNACTLTLGVTEAFGGECYGAIVRRGDVNFIVDYFLFSALHLIFHIVFRRVRQWQIHGKSIRCPALIVIFGFGETFKERLVFIL